MSWFETILPWFAAAPAAAPEDEVLLPPEKEKVAPAVVDRPAWDSSPLSSKVAKSKKLKKALKIMIQTQFLFRHKSQLFELFERRFA